MGRFLYDKSGDAKKRIKDKLDTKTEVIVIKRPLPIELHFVVWVELVGYCLYFVVKSMVSVAKGYYGHFDFLSMALYSLFFIVMSLYTIRAFHYRKMNAVISAVMFNVMVIMDAVLWHIMGYDHVIGILDIVMVTLCTIVLLFLPKVRVVFPVREWNVEAFESIVFGGYSLVFLLVIIFFL